MGLHSPKKQKNTSNLGRKYALILKIRVDSTSTSSVLRFVKEKIEQKGKFFIVTPNPEIVILAQSDTVLASILNSADLALPDGVGLVWASKIIGSRHPQYFSLKERVSGVDVLEELVKLAAQKNWRLFFLGGRPGVVEKAAEKFISQYRHIAISHDAGPLLDKEGKPINREEDKKENEIIQKINKFQPHLLFVGFGAPKQEKWAFRHFRELDVNGIMVVGGAFDYLSGQLPRAPLFIRLIGFEWLFRLILEPWRLGRQLNLIRFVFAVLNERT